MAKEQNKEIFKQGEVVNQIVDHVNVADDHIEKGKKEIEQAKDISESNDSFTDKACVASVIIVVILITMMLILPE